ncbi:YeeE/YedE family protein [Pseudooceanicola onchidii]|uniref:YeeE/YedE family protein n=1 Tax=Pseudooceanicola onchidii TaxID=2562279 RepID=UPI0010AAE1E2|nr:YeeE/YedE family protein [Pseudooceanicola onchidii]
MLEYLGDAWTMTLVGLVGGILLGLAARLGRFCTLGAIEDMLYGGSSRRMRMWLTAIALSVIGSFTLMAAGLFDPLDSYYLSLRWMPLAAVTGGLTFGYGMALAGNCGYGCIARLGGGDMRAFVIVLVMGVSAWFTLSGPLSWLRNAAFPQSDVIPGETPPGIAHWIAAQTGAGVEVIGIALGLALLAGAVASRSFLRDLPALCWSAVVAMAILSGWAGSHYVASSGWDGLQTVSHSFAAPVGESLLYVMTGSVRAPSFAVGSVFGVALGAFAGSLFKGHFRWEACEDPRELRRQILGAALMGVGAVVALGCTVGQGLTGFSVLAFSAPLTFAAIFVGAALGLRQLIEGFRRIA